MKCGRECEVFSRVVGYFGYVQNWNPGKQQEFKDRKTFKIDEEKIKQERENEEK